MGFIPVLLLVLLNVAFIGADTFHPSCYFNPLCTCSKAVPNLGIVTCIDVPLSRIPIYVNKSRVNSFHLENNALKTIEPYFLLGTGLYTLKVKLNPIHMIHEETFKGLEYSLRDLELSYLHLIEVPYKALSHLQKLHTLNLAGNSISDCSATNWANIRNTLETLILRENAITFVQKNSFERFTELKVLDLSKNAIRDLDPDAFFPYTNKLTQLYLSDNQLFYVPYAQLQHIKPLKILDLSYNFINSISAISESTRGAIQTKFSLNALHLEYNEIRELSNDDFQKFTAINHTYLDGNPISSIQFGAFQDTEIQELSFAGCGLTEFHSDMIQGLEKCLLVLDLSNNDLFTIDSDIFLNFLHLQELRTKGNKIQELSVPDYNGVLLSLYIGGSNRIDPKILLRDLGRVKSLIRVSLSGIEIPHLSFDSFIGFGLGVEELSILNANLRTISMQAFANVRGLKKLDLSNNLLEEIHEHAFAEIGHSLLRLHLSNSFAESVTLFPEKSLQHLISVHFLDASYNHFENLPVTSFRAMHDLEVLRMHDSRIKELFPETFLADIHVNLKEIIFSYNSLHVIKTNTFADLPELQYLNFEDNIIKKIESKAFVNLRNLRWLYLRGNKIEVIDQEAFENLPKLELLDLAFNNLRNFDFIALDQVGSLSSFTLNLSSNYFSYLRTYAPDIDTENIYNSNIKVLDLSSSHILDIADDYFTSLESSLTHLYVQNNVLVNISQEVFGTLSQLQWLDLSNNDVVHIDYHFFKDISKIQILNLSRNELYDLSPNLFNGMKNLRILDLSRNRLKLLPDFLFREDSLEIISLAQNRFERIPYKSFSVETAISVREVDLSRNFIGSIYSPDLFSRFRSLISLDLSGNRLSRIENSEFIALSNLLYLDLSANFRLELMKDGSSFNGLQENLISLRLNNISLNEPPDFSLQHLIYLHLSDNNISTFNPETVVNLTSLRVLDLSGNNLSTIPVLILSLRNLRSLNLSRNDIRVLTNNSLLSGFEELRELDITSLPLEIFETGALHRMISLLTLHVSTYPRVERYNIPQLLGKNTALQNLHLTANGQRLENEMWGKFPKKLRNVVIKGSPLKSVDSRILEGIHFPELSVTFEATKLEYLYEDIFWNMPLVRNISVNLRNNTLRRVSNPSTGTAINSYNRTFLVSLHLWLNDWNCDCHIGWIETWMRVKRQLLCHYVDFSGSKRYHDCLRTEDDLRKTRCEKDKESVLLLDILKAELECGWSRSSYHYSFKTQLLILSSFIAILYYIF